jgi:hypothetical protein
MIGQQKQILSPAAAKLPTEANDSMVMPPTTCRDGGVCE